MAATFSATFTPSDCLNTKCFTIRFLPASTPGEPYRKSGQPETGKCPRIITFTNQDGLLRERGRRLTPFFWLPRDEPIEGFRS